MGYYLGSHVGKRYLRYVAVLVRRKMGIKKKKEKKVDTREMKIVNATQPRVFPMIREKIYGYVRLGTTSMYLIALYPYIRVLCSNTKLRTLWQRGYELLTYIFSTYKGGPAEASAAAAAAAAAGARQIPVRYALMMRMVTR